MIELAHYKLITIPKYFLNMLFESESVSHSVMSDSLRPHGLYSLPGCFVHGIIQARILEWVAISFSNIAIQVIWILDYALNWPPWACFYLNVFNAVIGIHPNLQSLSFTSFLY